MFLYVLAKIFVREIHGVVVLEILYATAILTYHALIITCHALIITSLIKILLQAFLTGGEHSGFELLPLPFMW